MSNMYSGPTLRGRGSAASVWPLYWAAAPLTGAARVSTPLTFVTSSRLGDSVRVSGIGAMRYRASASPGDVERMARQSLAQVARGTAYTSPPQHAQARPNVGRPPEGMYREGARRFDDPTTWAGHTVGSSPSVAERKARGVTKQVNKYGKGGLMAVQGPNGVRIIDPNGVLGERRNAKARRAAIKILKKLARDAEELTRVGATPGRTLLGYDPVQRLMLFQRGLAANMSPEEALIAAIQATQLPGGGMSIDEANALLASGGSTIDRRSAKARLRAELEAQAASYGTLRDIEVRQAIARRLLEQDQQIQRHNALVREAVKHQRAVKDHFESMFYSVYRDQTLEAGRHVVSRAVWYDTEFAKAEFHRTELSRELGYRFGEMLASRDDSGETVKVGEQLKGAMKKSERELLKAANDPAFSGGKIAHSMFGRSVQSAPHFKPNQSAGPRPKSLVHAAGIVSTLSCTLDADQAIQQIAETYVEMGRLPARLLSGGRTMDLGMGILRHNIRKHTPVGPARTPSAKVVGLLGQGRGSLIDDALVGAVIGSREMTGDEVMRYHRDRTKAAATQLARDLEAVRKEVGRMRAHAHSKYLKGTYGVGITMAAVSRALSGAAPAHWRSKIKSPGSPAFRAQSAISALTAEPRIQSGSFVGEVSGRLIDSITTSYQVVPGGAILGATSNAPYAWFVEHGFYKNLEITPIAAGGTGGLIPYRASAFAALQEIRSRANRTPLPTALLDVRDQGQGVALPMDQLGGYPYLEHIYQSRKDTFRILMENAITNGQSGKWMPKAEAQAEERSIGFASKSRFYARGSSDVPRVGSTSGSPFGTTPGHHMFERGLQETYAQLLSGGVVQREVSKLGRGKGRKKK